MTDEIARAWPAWQLVGFKRATITEITTTLSIDDCDIGCQFLDYWIPATSPKKPPKR